MLVNLESSLQSLRVYYGHYALRTLLVVVADMFPKLGDIYMYMYIYIYVYINIYIGRKKFATVKNCENTHPIKVISIICVN